VRLSTLSHTRAVSTQTDLTRAALIACTTVACMPETHTTLEQKMINACGEASNVVVQPGAELPSCRKADQSITAFLTFDCVETLEIACAFPCCREATSA